MVRCSLESLNKVRNSIIVRKKVRVRSMTGLIGKLEGSNKKEDTVEVSYSSTWMTNN